MWPAHWLGCSHYYAAARAATKHSADILCHHFPFLHHTDPGTRAMKNLLFSTTAQPINAKWAPKHHESTNTAKNINKVTSDVQGLPKQIRFNKKEACLEFSEWIY